MRRMESLMTPNGGQMALAGALRHGRRARLFGVSIRLAQGSRLRL